MPGRKGSKSGKSKKGEAQQKEQEKGEIPSVPKSPDSGTPTIKSEGACGQSPTAEDSEQLEESLYDDSEEADGADSKQASGGRHSIAGWIEKRRLKKQTKKEKKKQGKVEKERKESQQEEEEQQEQSRSASHSKLSDKRTSCSSQHPLSLSEPPLPQRRRSHSESSQGSHVHANIQDATLEEGAKQASSQAQGVRKCLHIMFSGGFRWALEVPPGTASSSKGGIFAVK